ncbi:MAG: diiron oxygenase [Myxococcota bacterium]|nr:diiron oxygenase [Myxococcota bacterium]
MNARFEPPTAGDYERCVNLSERVAWTVDEILTAQQELDFTRPFLPEAMVSLARAPLAPADRLRLNHIRANSYLNLFVFVEEYIVATAMRHAQAEQFGSPDALRALLRFADEEIKHQQLFRRFRAAFERGFGAPCDVVENATDVAGFILARSPLGVLVTTLHLELVTQLHYVSSVREGASQENIEPTFRSLLKHHWLEESQHARIDELEIAKLAADAPAELLEQAVSDYLEILRAFDEVLARQTELDLDTLARLTPGIAGATRDELRTQQLASYRKSFLLDGLDHPTVIATLQQLTATAASQAAALAERYR